MMYTKRIIFSVGIFFVLSCQSNHKKNVHVDRYEIDSSKFESSLDGKNVNLYTIRNDNVQISVTNYGARLVSLIVKDKDGQKRDVILGYDSAKDYITNASNFYGAIVGRYGNRVANARFTLDNNLYTLEANNNGHSLHGGFNGVFNKVWTVLSHSAKAISFTYQSPEGEAGYPGNVYMKVTYSVNENNGLEIDYSAESDKKTVLNLTNHAYFNLNGAGDSSILDHQLRIDADKYTVVDKGLIPTGSNQAVEGTAFDFRVSKEIGRDIDLENEQLAFGKGYDHNFELNKDSSFLEVASLFAPKTGIEMLIFTTEPGLQFYSGNFMTKDDPKGKGGNVYPYRSALCLETQHFPDSPNQPNFPSTIIKPGEKYTSKTEYRFLVRK